MRRRRFFWRVALFQLGWMLGLSVFSWAQSAPQPVDLSKAAFKWTWVQGTTGMVEKWHLRCGPTTGSYSLLKELIDPAARQMPINQIITAEGTYFCVISAVNSIGASAPSTEVSFRAGKVPGPAATFEVLVP